MDADGAPEVLTMGRLGVDIYPLQTGVSLRQVSSFGKYLGGTAANVAVAAARYGRRSALISRTGTDPFGEYLHDALRGYRVDDRFVTPVTQYPTPVTFCEIFPPDDFPIYFYRLPKAPDLEIYPDELDLEAVRGADVFWVTGTGLSAEPSREATLHALRARARTGITVLDMDYRPAFWPTQEAARAEYAKALPHVTVAVGNLEECETAVGVREPRAAARALHELGVELAVVKQGPRGVLASRGGDEVAGAAVGEEVAGAAVGEEVAGAVVGEEVAGAVVGEEVVGEIVEVPPVPVEVVNGLGAGDAFGGALCHGLLAGWDLERTMRFANTAGAIVASRLACSDAMPTADEVEAVLEETARAR
jgi:5-dehydro-2-deoxygluconokinase